MLILINLGFDTKPIVSSALRYVLSYFHIDTIIITCIHPYVTGPNIGFNPKSVIGLGSVLGSQ